MSEVLDGVYLSGWEYNRLLQHDPITRRNSALPAEILWNGAAPLWLFRNVFCTREAIDNEWCAYDMLGWPTGRIFTELANRGVIQQLEWADLPDVTKKLVRHQQADLIGQQGDRSRIRALIAEGATAELDALKNSLIAPIAIHKHCALAVTPNSLRNWIAPSAASPADPADVVLRKIASRVPSGLLLCSPPGTGMPDALRAQAEVQREHEAPMIPDLLAGDGRFSGPNGYEHYLRALIPFRSAFAPINDQLYSDWERNKRKLFELRDAAEKNLWPFLHGEWIPALQNGDETPERFLALLDRELRNRRISPFLSLPGKIALVVAAASAAGVTSAMSALAALPGHGVLAASLAAGAGAAAGQAVSGAVQKAGRKYDHHQDESVRLTMFYQKASKIVTAP